MKVVRGILIFLVNLVLFGLILAFSIVLRTKSFVERDVIVPLLKEATFVELENEEITEDQKDLVETITSDNDFEKIVDRIIQNYLSFKTNKDYELSKEDYDLAMNYIIKYREQINKLSESKYTEQEIKDSLKYEDAKEYVKEALINFDEGAEKELIDFIINIYTTITSAAIKTAMIMAIVICILLIMLISWSLIKWLWITGVDLIISGSLIGILFALCTVGLSLVVKSASEGSEEVVANVIGHINFTSFIIMSIVEIVIGILMIVLYNILKKNNNQEPEEIQD